MFKSLTQARAVLRGPPPSLARTAPACRLSTARVPHPRDAFDRLHGNLDVLGFLVSFGALYYLFRGHRQGLLAAAAGAPYVARAAARACVLPPAFPPSHPAPTREPADQPLRLTLRALQEEEARAAPLSGASLVK